MKYIRKIPFIIFLFILIFIMYNIFKSNKITYIALGDSLALGENSYGVVDYGYADYIKDYLKENKKLRFYSKEYAQEGYRITDIINDIEQNKKIKVGNDHEGIKTLLRRSNLLTISVGSNDIIYKTEKNIYNLNTQQLNKYIDGLIIDYDKMLDEVTKYFKGNLIIVGYYNPYIYSKDKQDKLEESFMYINKYMNMLANKYDAKYINIYELFRENPEFLPNPNNIHPSKEGYKEISKLIINEIK